MSIAGKSIAGCSPIAGMSCLSAPLTTVFWGPTSEVFVPTATIELVTVFWGPTARVFKLVLIDPNAGKGDCIIVPRHLRDMTPFGNAEMVPQPVPEEAEPIHIVVAGYNSTMVAYKVPDTVLAPPHNNEAIVSGFQKCKQEAA